VDAGQAAIAPARVVQFGSRRRDRSMAFPHPKSTPNDRARGAWLGCAVLALGLGACAYGAGKDYTGTGDQNETSAPPPASTDNASGSGSATPPPPPPPPPAADAGGAPSLDSAAPPVDAGPVTCTKTLQSGAVSLSNHVCTDINTQITKGTVTLTYPCAGGVATATFGTQAFTGTVSAAGQVLITNVSNFTLGSCQLESTQTITGPIGTPPLAWSYGERFLGGDCSGDIICTASSKISVN
jgi:hypothetical protein